MYVHLLGSSLLGCKSAELLCTLFGMLSFLFTTFLISSVFIAIVDAAADVAADVAAAADDED